MRRGQALLVVLLIVGVVLTVGLAVVSRSVTEVNISTTQEESTRALEAAEAGVEKSLAGVFSGAGGAATFPTNDASVNVVNTSVGGSNVYTLPYDLNPGDVATVDLRGVTPAQLRLCWGDAIEQPVAEMMLYTQSGATVNMRKWVLGPAAPFTTPAHNNSIGCTGVTVYSYWQDWQPADPNFNWNNEALVMMRVRVVGNNNKQPLAVFVPSGALPVQGTDTISTGTSGSTSRKIRVTQVNPDIPFMFDSALFSGSSLIK